MFERDAARSYKHPPRTRTLVIAHLILAATVAASSFPAVAGRNLNGVAMRLPGDFRGPASLVFVAFAQRQQADVDSWAPVVRRLRATTPAVGVYELPTLSRGISFMRGFIDGGMRRGIQDQATRASTITLYIDKRAFDAALGIASEGEITVLLVRPDGTVLWRTSGAYAAGKDAGLNAALDRFVDQVSH
jgi:hypothetical protein